MLARSDGASTPRARDLERSLALAPSVGTRRRAPPRSTTWRWSRRARASSTARSQLTEQALALCVAQGDRHREAALENNLADLLHAAGRPEEAMEHLKRAVAIFAEVGADEATRLPEIWKLVAW